MIKLFHLIVLVCFIPYTLFAQKNVQDSLFRLLKASKPDSARVEILRNIGYSLEQTNAVAAKARYVAALKLSRQLKSTFLQAGCLIDLGDLDQVTGNYDSAEINFRQALSLGQQIQSPLRIGSAYLNLGNSFLYRNQPEMAINYYLLAAPQLEKINDNARLSALYANIEAVFYDLHNYAKSLEYGDKAIDWAKKAGNPGVIASAYVNTSNTMLKLGQKQCSIEYLKSALYYARKAPEINHLQDAYQNLADRFLNSLDFKKAASYADSSLREARIIGSSEVLSNALNMYGVVELKRNRLGPARTFLLKSNRYAVKNGGWSMLRENYSALADLENQQGNFRAAYRYEHLCAILKDSTLKESLNKQIGELEAKFQAEKKQTQITELEKSRQLQELALKQKNVLNIALLTGISALLVIILLFYINFRRRQQLAIQTGVMHTQRIRELEQEKQLIAMDAILKGQEDERSRMARDLHDGLGGMLSSVKLSLNGIGTQVINPQAANGISRTIDLLDNSITELRRIARNLMPEALLRFGLKDALLDLIHQVNECEERPFDHPTGIRFGRTFAVQYGDRRFQNIAGDLK